MHLYFCHESASSASFTLMKCAKCSWVREIGLDLSFVSKSSQIIFWNHSAPHPPALQAQYWSFSPGHDQRGRVGISHSSPLIDATHKGTTRCRCYDGSALRLGMLEFLQAWRKSPIVKMSARSVLSPRYPIYLEASIIIDFHFLIQV